MTSRLGNPDRAGPAQGVNGMQTYIFLALVRHQPPVAPHATDELVDTVRAAP